MLVSQLGERRYGASLHVTQRTVVYIEQSFKLLIYNLLLLTIIKSILRNVFSDECCFFFFYYRQRNKPITHDQFLKHKFGKYR